MAAAARSAVHWVVRENNIQKVPRFVTFSNAALQRTTLFGQPGPRRTAPITGLYSRFSNGKVNCLALPLRERGERRHQLEGGCRKYHRATISYANPTFADISYTRAYNGGTVGLRCRSHTCEDISSLCQEIGPKGCNRSRGSRRKTYNDDTPGHNEQVGSNSVQRCSCKNGNHWMGVSAVQRQVPVDYSNPSSSGATGDSTAGNKGVMAVSRAPLPYILVYAAYIPSRRCTQGDVGLAWVPRLSSAYIHIQRDGAARALKRLVCILRSLPFRIVQNNITASHHHHSRSNCDSPTCTTFNSSCLGSGSSSADDCGCAGGSDRSSFGRLVMCVNRNAMSWRGICHHSTLRRADRCSILDAVSQEGVHQWLPVDCTSLRITSRASWHRCFSGSSSTSRRVRFELLRQQWPLIRQEMVDFFRSQVNSDNVRVDMSGDDPVDHAADRVTLGDGENTPWSENRELTTSNEVFDEPSSRCKWGERGLNIDFSTGREVFSRGIYSMKARSGKLNILCRPWERFVRKEELQRANYVPCIVGKYGIERRLAIHRATLEALAFEEEYGHLSHFFQARLFRLHIDRWIEECIPTYVQADPVARRLYFVKFDRHIPGVISEIDVPTTLVGLLASPAYQKGYHVELVMPTIRCQCVGTDLPPPIFVDVSRLHFKSPYSAVTLADLQGVLPRDGTARFHPAYGDLQKQEVVWAYEVGTLPEAPLPDEFVDPNFINRKGQKMDVMFHRRFPN